MQAKKLYTVYIGLLNLRKMKRIVFIGLGCLVLLVLAAVGGGMSYLGFGLQGVDKGELVVIDPTATDQAQISKDIGMYYKVEEVATGLTVPWSLLFTDENRMLIAQRGGQVLEMVYEQLNLDPVYEFDLSAANEVGLMGMTKDPSYAQNRWLYFCMGYEKDGVIVNKVVRLRDDGGGLLDEEVIIDDIPSAQFHAGCRIHFGPDDKLYISTGDATDKWLAQDVNSLAGKMLRVNKDGSVPDDNPFAGSYIWSLGHRNSQGFDWHPVTGEMWASEHGPSVFDGPAGGDEINQIFKAGNYGWPLVSHEDDMEGMISPKLVFTPAEAPASGMFYDGGVLVGFENNFFFGALRGEGVVRVVLDEAGQEVLYFEKLRVDVGRVRDVVQGPDGLIYFSTSNMDGRGSPRSGDDKILRLNVK